jgi:hypothetical protein
MKKKRAMLTVDWDYFVPEDPFIHDFGHRENLMFLQWVWGTRTSFIDDIVATDDHKNFWSEIQKNNTLTGNVVNASESHLEAYRVAVDSQHHTIVTVDAHHDVWPYVDSDTEVKIECGSWLRFWLDSNTARRAYWVCADYNREYAEDHGHERLALVDSLDDIRDFVFSTTHVCRSGCWTPPWLDYRFQAFVNSGKFGYIRTLGAEEDESWDPMKPRWSRQEINSARKEDPAGRERVREMRRVVTSARAKLAATEEETA